MSIFKPENANAIRSRARSNLATSIPSGFVENTVSSFNTFRNNDRVGAEREQFRKSLDETIFQVKQTTGKTIKTPLSNFGEDAFFGRILQGQDALDPEDPKAIISPTENPFALVARLFDGVDNDRSEPQRLREFEKELEKIRESVRPEQRGAIKSIAQIRTEMRAKAAKLEAKNAEIASRATIPGALGQLTGGGAAAIIQPEVAVTLPFGAPVRAGLLAKMLIEAGIGVGTEAILQPSVQKQRASLGLESGLNRAIENIGLAGAGAGGLTAGIGLVSKTLKLIGKGGVDAFEKAVGRKAKAEEKAIVEQFVNDVENEKATPFDESSPEAELVHRENTQLGFEAAVDGRAIPDEDLRVDPVLTVKAARANGETIDIFKNDDLKNIGVDAKLMQFKAGGDELGVSDRLKGIQEWDTVKAGISIIYEFEGGKKIIVDGHQRLALAKRLAAQGKDIEFFAVTRREVDGVSVSDVRTEAASKNIGEGTGTATDAAKVIRDSGKTPSELGLPVNSALVRDGEGLARLDAETFGMVINDVISENFGAIIGRLVTDPRMQPEIARLIAKLKPASVMEAESITRQALESGSTLKTQTSLFGDEGVVQSLFLEKARVLSRSITMIKNNKKMFGSLERNSDEITSEGNILNQESNAQRLQAETLLQEAVQRLAHRKGIISDALNKAAREAQGTGDYSKAATGFVQTLTRAIREGKINVDDLSRGADDTVNQRAGSGKEVVEAGDFEQIDDEVLSGFDEAGSKAADDQADQINQEIKDKVETDTQKIIETAQQNTELRLDLEEKINAGATIKEIEAHPAVTQAIDEALGIPRTDQDPNFMNPEWRLTRQFEFADETVVGVDNAIQRFYSDSRAFAWLDDGLDVPTNPIKHEKIATLIIGPPAAGKSSVGNPIARKMGAVVIDSDEVKKALPGFRAGLGASAVHVESTVLAREVLAEAMAEDANILWGKIGDRPEKIERAIMAFKDAGYTINLVNMSVTGKEAYKRMFNRFIKTGRLIEPSYVRGVGDKPTQTYNALKKKGVADSYAEIDNNGTIDQPKTINEDPQKILEGVRFDDGGRRLGGSSKVAKESEGTAAGEQTLIDGVRPVTDADRLQSQANKPLRGGNSAAGGLFDVDARAQGDLLDFAVPVGEKFDADGKPVTETKTVREIMSDLEEDQNFLDELDLCKGAA